MNKQEARTILSGLLADGMNVDALTKTGRAEVRCAIDAVLTLLEPADMRDALKKCQTLTPSLLTGNEAVARLQEINCFVYDALGAP